MTSIVRPLTPPFALISAAAMRTTWFRRPSMLAIVPEDENRQPSLTVPAAWAGRTIAGIATDVVSAAAPSPVPRRNERRENLAENLAIDQTSSCEYGPISDHRLGRGNAK